MKKKWIFLVIFVLLIIGTLFYFYYTEERPLREMNVTFSDITILATDESGNKISTGFKITGGFSYEGKTSRFGDVLAQAPVNVSVKIQNKNLEDQNYYTFTSEAIFIKKDQKYRVNLKLIEPGELEINHEGVLGDENITLFVKSSGTYMNPIFCTTWGPHVIFVKSNYTETGVPIGLLGYTKCYVLGKNIMQETKIVLNEKIFGVLDENDFIRVIFIDRDFGEGQGGLDYEYDIFY